MTLATEIEARPFPKRSPPVADCRGACLPSPGGTTIDQLYAHCLVGLRRQALSTIEGVAGAWAGWVGAYLEKLHAGIESLPIHDFITSFRPAVAFFHLDLAVISRDPSAAALGLVRFLVGGPNDVAGGWIVPEQAIPAGGLYLPHPNLVLAAGCGPIAVQSEPGRVRFTWTDGLAIEIPPEGVADAVRFDDDRMISLERAGGWPILNRAPEARDSLLGLSPPPTETPASADMQMLEEGRELLRDVWPQAHAATRRYLHSAMLQPVHPEHSTSITLDRLQGTFVASCRDPVQVADALVHEGAHARLALFLRVDPLIEDDGAEIHDSPWRRDKRPLKGVLNGVHSFVNVVLFYRRLAEMHPEFRDVAMQIHDEQRNKVRQAWATVEALAHPTALGESFLTELQAAVEEL